MTIHISIQEKAKKIIERWNTEPRWKDVTRGYDANAVAKLQGTVKIEHSLATRGANKFWKLLNTESYTHALGALTGGQALQQVKAGIKAIYLSGWQVAADANTSSSMYPDQSLYPVNSVPTIVEKINNTFQRADEIQNSKGIDIQSPDYVDYFAPIIADAEAGFGGVLNAFELTKALIKAGASAVHLEDQLASAKKCGHMGGKVLVPTQEAVQKLIAARLAADVLDVPTVLIARTDSVAATLITSDIDDRDKPFITGERTEEGFYRINNGIDIAVARAMAYAPYADVLWCETGTPDIEFATKFAKEVKAKHPNIILSYNCSPSFNWKKNLSDAQIKSFQKDLAALGYRFQFITLAGIHSMWYNMFDLAYDYHRQDMTAYVEKVQQPEFNSSDRGYTFTSHQQEVGTGYFDEVMTIIQGGKSSITSLAGSTEEQQFK